MPNYSFFIVRSLGILHLKEICSNREEMEETTNKGTQLPVFWPPPSMWTAPQQAPSMPACPEGVISNRFMTRCENDRRLSEFIIIGIEQISGLFLKTVWTLRIFERRVGGRTDSSKARGTSYFTRWAASATCVQNGRGRRWPKSQRSLLAQTRGGERRECPERVIDRESSEWTGRQFCFGANGVISREGDRIR